MIVEADYLGYNVSRYPFKVCLLSAISPIGREIPDVGLTNLPLWECDQIAILALWLYHTTLVQTDSVNMESVVRCGQRCTSCTIVTTFGNGCDTMTQRLLPAWILWDGIPT